jgi:transposase
MTATLTQEADRSDRSARIVADYLAGLSGPRVADVHAVSRSTVYRKLHEAGVPRRQRWSVSALRAARAQRAVRERQDQAALIARAVQMGRAGATMATIAREVGRHPCTVKKWLLHNGVEPSRRSMTTEERDAALADMRILRARGWTLKQIQTETGHGWQTVKTLLGEPVTRRGVR